MFLEGASLNEKFLSFVFSKIDGCKNVFAHIEADFIYWFKGECCCKIERSNPSFDVFFTKCLHLGK